MGSLRFQTSPRLRSHSGSVLPQNELWTEDSFSQMTEEMPAAKPGGPMCETWDVPSLQPANASQIIDWFLSACFCNRCLSCVTVRLKIWKHSRPPKYCVVQQVTCGKPFLSFFFSLNFSITKTLQLLCCCMDERHDVLTQCISATRNHIYNRTGKK